jgi:hypothetical protein
MTVKKHQMPLYLGTYAERILETLVAEAAGSLWLETDTSDLYVWDGNSWAYVGGTSSLALDDLNDVYISSPSDGNVLGYVGSVGLWEAITVTGMGGGALEDLTDVNINSPSNGQALVWDSSSSVWENATLEGALSNKPALVLTSGSSVDNSCGKNGSESGHSNVSAVYYPHTFQLLTGVKFTPDADANYRFYLAEYDGTEIAATSYSSCTSGTEKTFTLTTAVLLTPYKIFRIGIQRETGTGAYPYRTSALDTIYGYFTGGYFESTYYSGNPLAIKVTITPYTPTVENVGGSSGADASDITYTPSTLTDWDGDADPGNVDDALDQLANNVDEHLSAAAPHSGHELISNKGAVSGYAPLDATQKIPTANLGGAGASGSNFLRGDQTWAVPSGLSDGNVFFVIDGGGSVIVTGSKGYVICPFSGTITGWTILGDIAGSIVIDVKKSTYASFPSTTSIAGTEKPTLAGVQKNQDLSLGSWTTALTAGDILEFVVDSVAIVTRVQLSIKITKTS